MTRFVPKCLCVAVIAMLFTAMPVHAADESTAELVPLNAAGFVHVNVEQLRDAEQLESLNDLINRVDQELGLVFRRHLGVNGLHLREVTFALPDFHTAFGGNHDDPPAIGFFNFSQAYHSGAILDAIGGPWEEVKGENSLYYLNEDGLAVLFLSDNTLICGLEPGLDWWIDSLNEELDSEPLINAVAHAAEGATVTLAVNTADLPSELLNEIPPPLRPFADSDAVILNFYLGEELEIFLAVDFATSREASQAERGFRGLIDLGRSMLDQEAGNLEDSLEDGGDDLEEALGNLAALALLRHADAHLQNIRIDRDDYQLQADLIVDVPMPTLLFGSMAGIAAIGAESNAEFETIADQLGTTAN